MHITVQILPTYLDVSGLCLHIFIHICFNSQYCVLLMGCPGKKDDSSAGKKSGWQRGRSIIPHMTFAQFQEISPPHPGHCNIH